MRKDSAPTKKNSPEISNASSAQSKKILKNLRRDHDPTLSWVSRDFPHLEDPWKALALGWFLTLRRVSREHLYALSQFLGRYLTDQGLPSDPATLLRKDSNLPKFFETSSSNASKGAYLSNAIRSFLDYVLKERFSVINPLTGQQTIHPDYHNPEPRRNTQTLEVIPDRPAGLTRGNDIELTWVRDHYPQLETWRLLAIEWIKGQEDGL